MATEFKKLSEVTVIEESTDNAHVLIEENGEIYRVPKTAVGGAQAQVQGMVIELTAEYGEVN